MAGINTGSFFSRLGSQMPGMVNSLAQNYGAQDMAQGVRASSALLNRQPKRKMPSMPKPTNGIPAGQMPGTPVKMEMPGIMKGGGINTAPTTMPFEMPQRQIGIPGGNFFRGGDMGGMGGGFWNPNAPKLDPNTGQYNTPNQNPLGGLFGAYNRIRF